MSKYFRYQPETGSIVAELSITEEVADFLVSNGQEILPAGDGGATMKTHWIENGKISLREPITGTLLGETFITGTEFDAISGLPSDAWIRVRSTNQQFVETRLSPVDGKLRLTTDKQGTYTASFIGKYIGDEIVFEVIDLPVLKSRISDRVNEKRAQVLGGGMVWNGSRWDVDSVSQAAITNIVASVNAGQALPEGFYWRDFDDNNVPMSESDMSALGNAVISFNFAVHSRGSALKALIDEASTLDEVLAIDIEAGWPE